MRKYAWLKEPQTCDGGAIIYKVMLYENGGEVYLFEYSRPEAILCSSDRWYGSLKELYEDWNGLIDEKGWIEIEDPLPDCQHDAFIPLRVKGRDVGRPEWGEYETFKDGKWVEYKPAEHHLDEQVNTVKRV